MLRTNHYNRKAIVMVLIISSLTLVGVVALALLSLVKTGTAVAKLDIINTRANFVAQSGINYAIANLVTFAKRRFVPNVLENYTYFGEDANTNGTLESNEDVNDNGFLDTISCDIGDANFPSYAKFLAVIKDKSPVKFVSGLLPSMFKNMRNSDVFIIKAVDTSSKIYIFDKNPKVLQIVRNLVDYLALDISENELENLLKNLNGSIEKLEENFNEHRLKILRSYLTFHGSPDNKVIEPVPYYDRNKKLEINKEVYSWIDYLPYKISLASRAPISINTASVEIIYANLANIKGTYINELEKKSVLEIPSDIKGFQDIWKFLFKMAMPKRKPSIGILREVSIDNTVAVAISEEIKKRRVSLLKMVKLGEIPNRPLFYNWEEFEVFLNGLVANNTISSVQKDLILANANPNTNLNKFNPSQFYSVDKTDLINYTTEFTLGTSGIFEVESLSYILESDGQIDKVAGQATVKKFVKIFDIIKDTTQEDFENGIVNKDMFSSINVPLAEIYPVSDQFKNIIPKWVDGQIMMARVLNSDGNLFQSNTKDYYLFTDGYYSTLNSNFCFPIPKEIFNKKKWRFTLTFWMKPNFSFDNEVNPRLFASFIKGDLEKMNLNYFLLFFMPTRNNMFNNFNVASPFLFYSYPSSETNHQWWATNKNTIFYRNQWHFVAIVVNGAVSDTKWMTRIYVNNGEEVQTQFFFEYSGTQPKENTVQFGDDDKFCFGVPKGLGLWDFPSETTFDNIALFPKALSQKDVKAIFGKGRFRGDNEFVFTSRKFDLSNRMIGTINWNDNSTIELSIGGISTYYSLVSLQLFDKDNKSISEELFNSVGSPVNKTDIDSFNYKVKFNTKEFTDEHVLIDSPVINEVIITVIPKLQKDMILTSFSTHEK